MQHRWSGTSNGGIIPPESPRVAASASLLDKEAAEQSKFPATTNGFSNGSFNSFSNSSWDDRPMQLELQDGTAFLGTSFGAEKSVSGELVFQTGMVGYPESITDPSYRGQILVITFPLIGNYGVPSRQERDPFLWDLPAFFESTEIHVAGIVVASYCGEDFSHHLATSSLGSWLKEQGVPAMQGVDTRALTKRIREGGCMLGKMLLANRTFENVATNGDTGPDMPRTSGLGFEEIDWVDPNTKNLVADGKRNAPRP